MDEIARVEQMVAQGLISADDGERLKEVLRSVQEAEQEGTAPQLAAAGDDRPNGSSTRRVGSGLGRAGNARRTCGNAVRARTFRADPARSPAGTDHRATRRAALSGNHHDIR